MKIVINGAVPVVCIAATYLAVTESYLWYFLIVLAFAGCIFDVRWDSHNGWRFFHESADGMRTHSPPKREAAPFKGMFSNDKLENALAYFVVSVPPALLFFYLVLQFFKR